MFLTVPVPCISESCIEIKVKLNFYFHTSLWCLERFYEGLIFSLRPGSGRERLMNNFCRKDLTWESRFSKKSWHLNISLAGNFLKEIFTLDKQKFTVIDHVYLQHIILLFFCFKWIFFLSKTIMWSVAGPKNGIKGWKVHL